MGERADDAPPKPATPDRKDEEIARLRREIERLRRENDRLKRELDAARRTGKRQAAPFSKGGPTPRPKRAGRQQGPRHGRHGHRRPPRHVDETIDVPLPPQCPGCGGSITETRFSPQVQEDLPVVRPHVRRFDVHVGSAISVGGACRGAIPSRPRMRSARPARTWARTRSP